jgi:hypothetical protein
MNMRTLRGLLIEMKACNGSIDWVGDKTIERAVEHCYRGDWMIWIAKTIGVDDRKLTLAKGLCAQTFMFMMREDQSKKAIQAAIDYGNGLIGDKELLLASHDAKHVLDTCEAIADDNPSFDKLVEYGLACCAYVAADKLASAGNASLRFGIVSGYTTIEAQKQLEMAEICRQVLSDEIISTVNKMLAS